ncbi:hypothetical protein Tsubulata_019048 [Turnera subulata]|uniref:Ycf20-like protein n=1 Tax=Turnera subulata TaxID=218843 RepID=A0A9Q0JJI2_9ROSI|nr:hypothetical protein Tsubulata_019048 [Turnera subulata]
MVTTTMTLPNCPSKSNARLITSRHHLCSGPAVITYLRKTSVSSVSSKVVSFPCSFARVADAYVFTNFGRIAWQIRSSADSSGLDPSSSSGTNGSTRLFRTIQSLQTKLGARIRELRKNLPMKILFFLVGFYCATAFATVIGQTGDWDILSAALAVVVVEGIGALMYRASLPLMNNIRSLITMFNYWKAGLSLGLFLDSFKYEINEVMSFSSPSSFELDIFSLFF